MFFILIKVFEEQSLRRQFISFSVRIYYLQKRNTLANHDWKSSLGYCFILFWALETKSYEKGPFGVFFHIHSDSLNMNDTEFSFTRLVKLNIERPVLGTNHSSLRFVKHMSLDLSSDKLYQVFVTLFKTKKRQASTMMGEMGRESFCK